MVPYTYFMLLRLCPSVLKPVGTSSYLGMSSIYRLKKSDEKKERKKEKQSVSSKTIKRNKQTIRPIERNM